MLEVRLTYDPRHGLGDRQRVLAGPRASPPAKMTACIASSSGGPAVDVLRDAAHQDLVAVLDDAVVVSGDMNADVGYISLRRRR